MDALDQITDKHTVDGALKEAIVRLEKLAPSAERERLLSDARHYHGLMLSWTDVPPDEDQQFQVIANVMHLLATIRGAAVQPPRGAGEATPRPTQTVPPPAMSKKAEGSAPASPRRLGRVKLASIPPPADIQNATPDRGAARGSGIRRLRPHLKSWDPVAELPGVRCKRLSTTPPTSVLLRLEPGARLPRHRHGSREHIHLLDGLLQHGDTELYAGEHIFVEAGALSGPFVSQGECTLMIVGSDRPELR